MKTNLLISDLRNIATSGSNPIEFKIEDSQLLFWCNEIRAMLISQAISKKQDISDSWIQILSCLELEQVDSSECCEITTDCYILRTVREIPNTIETWMDNSILKVTLPTGEIITKSNPYRSQYSSYSKYTSSKPTWFIKNKRIYITVEQLWEKINVWGIFENPSELSTFVSCGGNPCFTYDDDYPCSLKMANEITNIVLKTKIYPYLQLPADNTNDGINQGDTPLNTKGL
jgi:hypothetical protein